MKNILLALAAIFGLSTGSWGQTGAIGSGIYRSAEDFRQHRLTLAVDCKTATHKLRLHEFSGKRFMTVKHGGKVYQLAKDSLFGFRDCDGRDYRFASNYEHYPILNPGEEVLLYKIEQPTVGKNPGFVRLYFSSSAQAPVQPLTLLTLKRAFPDNHAFHDLLDAQFHAGGDLTMYDTYHRMTKINWLLCQSRTDGAGPH
ncbi:hypothetical protein FY528_15640 [Hymenobacter lutimineralis]|uniref:DUF4450 domain-containing protein n=1 Tax=Hymenobacter lutimineralis TaxID=2606448 RepID=A0A5D6UW45_9BACT|nr:hypothetical protein [Hymenobacter lutimineralis]TYZ07247.1 hypothetical protein FY528_15640 [Hymenobacter lutimineralis]